MLQSFINACHHGIHHHQTVKQVEDEVDNPGEAGLDHHRFAAANDPEQHPEVGDQGTLNAPVVVVNGAEQKVQRAAESNEQYQKGDGENESDPSEVKHGTLQLAQLGTELHGPEEVEVIHEDQDAEGIIVDPVPVEYLVS